MTEEGPETVRVQLKMTEERRERWNRRIEESPRWRNRTELIIQSVEQVLAGGVAGDAGGNVDGSITEFTVDGEPIDDGRFEGQIENDSPLAMDASASEENCFRGKIERVEYRSEAVSPEELR